MRTPDPFSPWFTRRLALLLCLDAALVLTLLPRLTLWNIDEGRIAEVAREMALSGDFVTPRLGGIPFACYPPLPYWLMAASGSIIGWSEFAVRLPNALCGIALVAVVALMTRRLAGEQAGLAAGTALATMPGFFIQESMCRTDVMTMFFATLAFDRFLAWAEADENDRRERDLALMYISVSLGILAKGPLAIAVLGTGGLGWFLLRRRWSLLFKMGFHWGLPLAAAIVVPWYVLVYRSAGADFLRTNLLDENLRAFTDGFEQGQPWHFYLRTIPAVTLPWLLALGLAGRVRRARGLGLALAWTAGVFLFLTVSSAKRQSYVTYVDPPLAMAAGISIAASWEDAPGLARRSLIGLGGLLLAVAVGVALVPGPRWTAPRLRMIADLLPLLAILAGAAGLVLVLVAWRRGPVPATVTLACLLAAGFVLYRSVLETRWESDGRDGRDFCRRIAKAVPPSARIAVLDSGQLDGAFHFYVGAPLPALSGEPGYYVVAPWQREEIVRRGRTLRELDSFKDARRRDIYFIQVTE